MLTPPIRKGCASWARAGPHRACRCWPNSEGDFMWVLLNFGGARVYLGHSQALGTGFGARRVQQGAPSPWWGLVPIQTRGTSKEVPGATQTWSESLNTASSLVLGCERHMRSLGDLALVLHPPVSSGRGATSSSEEPPGARGLAAGHGGRRERLPVWLSSLFAAGAE